MICRGSGADKGPFRTVQCGKFAPDKRGPTGTAAARYLREPTRLLTSPNQGARCKRRRRPVHEGAHLAADGDRYGRLLSVSYRASRGTMVAVCRLGHENAV